MPPIRQTQSYLRGLFARHGISPQHRLGQNFLIDLNIHELIVSAAEVDAFDVVLEVGSGAGALTALLAARGHRGGSGRRPGDGQTDGGSGRRLATRASAVCRCPGGKARDRPDGA